MSILTILRGPQGVRGPVGLRGERGLMGTTGPTGSVGATGAPGSALNSAYRATVSSNLLSTGTSLLLAPVTGKRFLATEILIEIKSVTGTPDIYPVVKVGNNGGHDNIAPLFIVSDVGLYNTSEMPLTIPVASIDVGTTGISVEVLTAGSGGSVTILLADITIIGVLK